MMKNLLRFLHICHVVKSSQDWSVAAHRAACMPHPGDTERDFKRILLQLGDHTRYYRCAPSLNPQTSSCQLCNIHLKVLLCCSYDEACGWGQTCIGYLKVLGLPQPRCSYLKAPIEPLSACHHLFSMWLMSPQASLGLHYLRVYCGNVRTFLCVERVAQIDGQRSNCDLAHFHFQHRFTWYKDGRGLLSLSRGGKK